MRRLEKRNNETWESDVNISVGKSGTVIKLTQTEERKLDEAKKILDAVERHCAVEHLAASAGNISAGIGAMVHALRTVAEKSRPVRNQEAPGSDSSKQDGKQASGTPNAA